jgi:hypothetical protein
MAIKREAKVAGMKNKEKANSVVCKFYFSEKLSFVF